MTVGHGSSNVHRWVVSGRVQGVGFRMFVRRVALDLGLSGYVRNLPDRTVEVTASGPAEAIAQLSEALRAGPPASHVDAVTPHAAPPPSEQLPSPFEIVL